MNRIKFLFILFFLLQNAFDLKAQEIHNLSEAILLNQEKILQQFDELSNPESCFYYDKIVGNLSSELDGDYLLENLTRQIWNESSASWVNDSLYEHSYNGNNLVDTIIAHKWRYGTTWGNEFKKTYNYNSNNKLIFENHWSWGGGWGEDARYYYGYYGNGKLLDIQYHSLVNGDWRYLWREVYTWNEFNLEKMIAAEGWWTFYNYWGPFWKEEYYYDSTNSLIMKEKSVHYLLNHWELDIRDLYYYEYNGSDKENIRQDWNDTDSIWVNDYRYLYEYDVDNLLLSVLYQDWKQDSLDWENVWRETYTYTPQNKPATMFKETWTTATGWTNYVFRTYFYDSNYNWTEKLTQLWDGSDWKNYYRHLATWLEPVSVWETPPYLESYHLYNNYPNPFNPSTKIKFILTQSLSLGERVSEGQVRAVLKVYDILGNEVATLLNEEKAAGEYELEFNGEGLPSGIYFYTLRAGAFTETKKMILLK